MIEGKTIAITRSKEDSEEFIELITNEGAKPLPLPTIQLVSKGEKIVTEFILFYFYECKSSEVTF